MKKLYVYPPIHVCRVLLLAMDPSFESVLKESVVIHSS